MLTQTFLISLLLIYMNPVLSRLRPPVLKSGHTPLPQEQWFVQTLDHFSVRDSRTWKQRYWVSWEHYKEDGPIFLMIGGEGEENPAWLQAGALSEYAKQFNGGMFILEHRYYGQSRPTSDTSVKNLAWLSSSQALADLASFITSMKASHTLNGPWVAIGGSYPGSLAGWLRLKYPHLVAGSVASSGPVWAKEDFPEYLQVVTTALDKTKSGCSESLRTAVEKLSFLTSHRVGWRMINKMFQLCTPFDGSNQSNVATLIEALIGNVETVVQYNKDKGNITTGVICNIMTDKSQGSELQRFAAVNNLSLQMAKTNCLDNDYDNKVKMMRRTDYKDPSSRIPGDVGNRQWFYQTCTEFGWYQSSDQRSYPYGKSFPVDFFISMCSDMFGTKFGKEILRRGIQTTITEYGGRNLSVSNVVFVHGSLDPWHALGITTNISESAPAILIPGTSHCSNLYPSSDEDPPQLIKARKKIGDLIGKWIGK